MAYEKIYTVDSPEVQAYLAAFPDVGEDAAIGSVQGIHTAVVNGDTIAGDSEVVGQISTMIQDYIIANPEVAGEDNAVAE